MKSKVKKFLALFLCICMLMGGTVYAQEEGSKSDDLNLDSETGGVGINESNFPDDNFREYVKKFDSDNDGKLSVEEISDVTKIYVNGMVIEENISDLIGIEYFTALTELSCVFNGLTDLDVSANTKLQKLVCTGNQLRSLDVSANTKLKELNCSSNQLGSLDVSKNANLSDLSCYGNQLESLDVSANSNLIHLSCTGNQLEDLDVSKNVNLSELRCHGNQLESLDVSKNVNLTLLDCGGNQLKSLDVSKNVNLSALYCYESSLKSLDVSKNVNLGYLECHDNQLEFLNVNGAVNLANLNCDYNQLKALDISANTNLIHLNCSSNQLENLDVSKNVNLIALYCNANELTTLDVRNCHKLSYLNVRPLEKADVQYAKEPSNQFLYGSYIVDIGTSTNPAEVNPETGGVDSRAISEAFGIGESDDARVIVEQKESAPENQKFIINHASGFGDKILKVYDIVMNLHIDGQPDAIPITDNFGKLTLSFYAGTEYAGKTVTIYQLHENADGTNEVILHKNLKVEKDGMVTITVDKLSTFGISLQNTTAQNLAGSTTDANNRPNILTTSNGNNGSNGNYAENNAANTAAQTGDSANMTVWVALMMLTMTIIPIVAILGRRQKR